MKLVAFGALGFVTGVSQAPNVSVDLTPILVALMTLIGVLVTSGVVITRIQKNKAKAETRKLEADAKLAESQTGLTHAQYEGFIAEAAERLSHISETAIARLEAELARANQRIAELEAELERVKRDRDRALSARLNRERELTLEIAHLRDQVVDLERRLEVGGTPGGRRRNDPHRSTEPEDHQRE